MRWHIIILTLVSFFCSSDCSPTSGLTDLVRRRLPDHVDKFTFDLTPENHTAGVTNDRYSVSCNDGKVTIEGNSISALASGSDMPVATGSGLTNRPTDYAAT